MGTNSRQIVFLEAQDTKGKKKNGFNGTESVDPWEAPYQITSDTNYSSLITTAGTNGAQKVRKNYAVWTDPSKQTWFTVRVPPDRRYVESW